MKHKIIFCFSGQGSQYYKMGKELYEQSSTFKQWMNRLDEIVKPLIHESVVSILYNEQAKLSTPFERTIFTHPAIFMFEYALYQVFIEKGIVPDLVMGASMGEYVAAAVAGILNYEEILHIVTTQALLLEKNCPPAGMAVVLYKLEYFAELQRQCPDIELASINSKEHFVIAGPRDSLIRLDKLLKEKNIIIQILPVSHGFHSRQIDAAGQEFLPYLTAFNFRQPSLPYLSNVTGTCLQAAEEFKNGYFWDVCRKPILFKQAVEYIEKTNPYIYLDLGPSGTLANLARLNLSPASGSKVQQTINPFGRDLLCLNKTEAMLKNTA